VEIRSRPKSGGAVGCKLSDARQRDAGCGAHPDEIAQEGVPRLAFAAHGDIEFPGAQLLITDEEEPLRDYPVQRTALAAAGLDHTASSFRSDEWPAIRLVPPDSFADAGSRTLTFACRRRDAFPDSTRAEDETNWAMSQRANLHVSGLVSRWALQMLLDEHRNRLATMRDLAASQASARVGTLRGLKTLRRLTVTEVFDAEVVAHEVGVLASDAALFGFDVLDMVDVWGEHNDVDPELLAESMRQRQVDASERLSAETRLLVGSMTATSNLSANISNLRLQRWVSALAAISIAIAIWAGVRSTASPQPSPTPTVTTIN